MAHALLNGVALSCYAVSLGARRYGSRGFGIALAYTGYALVSAYAYLGGELSFNHGIGTKHTAVPVNPPDEFIAVLPEAALTSEPQLVDQNGIALLLARDGTGISAVSAPSAPHRGASLIDGEFADGCVTCPWHGARFALRDGAVLEGPAVYPLARFETRVVNGTIEVRAYG